MGNALRNADIWAREELTRLEKATSGQRNAQRWPLFSKKDAPAPRRQGFFAGAAPGCPEVAIS